MTCAVAAFAVAVLAAVAGAVVGHFLTVRFQDGGDESWPRPCPSR
jgi:hypothetical protein